MAYNIGSLTRRETYQDKEMVWKSKNKLNTNVVITVPLNARRVLRVVKKQFSPKSCFVFNGMIVVAVIRDRRRIITVIPRLIWRACCSKEMKKAHGKCVK